MASLTFLTPHARVLLLVAHDPGVRLRDIAASLNITERSAFGLITDLTEAGYVVKEKAGRRNRYHLQAHLLLPEPNGRERTIGEILDLLAGTGTDRDPAGVAADPARLDLYPRICSAAQPWPSWPGLAEVETPPRARAVPRRAHRGDRDGW